MKIGLCMFTFLQNIGNAFSGYLSCSSELEIGSDEGPFSALPAEIVQEIFLKVNDFTAIPFVCRRWSVLNAGLVKQKLFSRHLQDCLMEDEVGPSPTYAQLQLRAFALISEELKRRSLISECLNKNNLASFRKAERLIENSNLIFFCRRIPNLPEPPQEATLTEKAAFYKEALDEFDCAQVTRLDLFYLSRIPIEIGRFTNLEHLELWCHQLTILPDSLGQLVHLEELIIGNSQITFVPASLRRLPNLRIEGILDESLISKVKDVFRAAFSSFKSLFFVYEESQ